MTKATADRLSSAIDRSKHGRQQEEGVLVIRTIAMPADTNPAGDIFRGATLAVEAMQFLHPVKVGDEVTIYASLRKVGRTSIRVHVDVWSSATPAL